MKQFFGTGFSARGLSNNGPRLTPRPRAEYVVGVDECLVDEERDFLLGVLVFTGYAMVDAGGGGGGTMSL